MKYISHIEYERGVQIWSNDNDHCLYFPRLYFPRYSNVWNNTVTVFFKKGSTYHGPRNWEPA
jgi:hypothetical protein